MMHTLRLVQIIIYIIGCLLQHLNGFNKSLDYFQKALNLKPDIEIYQNYIDHVLIHKLIKINYRTLVTYKKAKDYIKKK